MSVSKTQTENEVRKQEEDSYQIGSKDREDEER
jgi:hypothetical protein